MANGGNPRSRQRHFFLKQGLHRYGALYRSPRQGGQRPVVPERDRAHHGGALLGQVDTLRVQADAAREAQQAAGMDEGLGLQVEFESFPEIELAFERLARERSGIELLNVRHTDDRTCATVFVPDGKLDHFERLIRDYLEEKRDSAGRVRDNRTLVDTVRAIRVATLQALWTDEDAEFPTEEEGSLRWEVWLPARGDRRAQIAGFPRASRSAGNARRVRRPGLPRAYRAVGIGIPRPDAALDSHLEQHRRAPPGQGDRRVLRFPAAGRTARMERRVTGPHAVSCQHR